MNDDFAILAIQSTIANFASVAIWAALAGIASMIVYRWVSPQKKLKALQAALKDAQQRMSQYDGEFDGLWQLIKENLRLSMKRVGWSLGPSLIAGMPVILLFVALDYRHNNLFEQLQQKQHASALESSSSLEFRDRNDEPVVVRVEHVVDNKPVTLDYLAVGPTWMRSWIFTFILVSSIAALVVKFKQGSV